MHGSAPDVGVVGYTLGGGLSCYARKLGLAGNHVTAIELVTAHGELVRATEHEHADLFWALRGGGGAFGIVTAIEFDAFPIERAYAGWLVWPSERAAQVLSAWTRWTRTLPDSVTSLARILQLPPVPGGPAELAGRQLVVVEARGGAGGGTAAGAVARARARDRRVRDRAAGGAGRPAPRPTGARRIHRAQRAARAAARSRPCRRARRRGAGLRLSAARVRAPAPRRRGARRRLAAAPARSSRRRTRRSRSRSSWTPRTPTYWTRRQRPPSVRYGRRRRR
jgi:FAD/FMN-containing dehydrogenase